MVRPATKGTVVEVTVWYWSRLETVPFSAVVRSLALVASWLAESARFAAS